MINVVCGIKSTGRICTDLATALEAQGHEVKIAYGREAVPESFQKYAVRIGNEFDVKLHGLKSRLLDAHGLGSKRATRTFLQWAEEYQPDLLWLHNIHGYYINYELLFSWIKRRPEMEVKWTLHDCWAFTGHCSYFTVAKCEQWKTHCSYCLQKRRYPMSLFMDCSRKNYDRKKASFTGVKNMTLITPSQWLANLVKQSFLNKYPVEVWYNTIDTNVFKPTSSDFRERYGLQGKTIVLGVASGWDERKGLDDFIELAGMLDDHYAIVLVGLNEKQIKQMPKKITALRHTNSSRELAEIYTAADVFVNPSKEETFGMTTVEAEVCGTQAIVYQDTACEEVVRHSRGTVIPQSVKAIYREITGHDFIGEGGKSTPTMIYIKRTNSTKELAQIYTAANVFVNPTHEDNYPTVNLEAIACGTPVITYDTGGCRETVT